MRGTFPATIALSVSSFLSTPRFFFVGSFGRNTLKSTAPPTHQAIFLQNQQCPKRLTSKMRNHHLDNTAEGITGSLG